MNEQEFIRKFRKEIQKETVQGIFHDLKELSLDAVKEKWGYKGVK